MFKVRFFLLTALLSFSDVCRADLTARDFGLIPHPKVLGTYVYSHVDHYPTEGEVMVAEGMFDSVKRVVKDAISFKDLPEAAAKPLILPLKAAAFYGHGEATGWLYRIMKGGFVRYFGDYYGAALIGNEGTKLWATAEGLRKEGREVPTDEITHYPGSTTTDAAASKPLDPASTDVSFDDTELPSEKDPLLPGTCAR